MKVLVCGSRDWTDYDAIYKRLKKLDIYAEIIEGGQRGADLMAKEAAETIGLDYIEYGANWKREGRSAGPIRNRKMLDREKPDLVIAFPLPQSKGTLDMIAEAERRGIEVDVCSP